jgi:hypothetical protein
MSFQSGSFFLTPSFKPDFHWVSPCLFSRSKHACKEQIGLPHASTDLISELVWTIGHSSKGMQFDALDGQPADPAVCFLVPQGNFNSISTCWAI